MVPGDNRRALVLPLCLSSLFLLFLSLHTPCPATATATASPPACGNKFDCNLNGECVGGVCECAAGWTGAQCASLDLLPAPTTPAFYRAENASWGGSIVEMDGLFHMYLAIMEGSCGLNSWIPNSAIYHATAAHPLGPYVNETKILDWFSHNPSASLQPDGTLLVWHIGCGDRSGSFVHGCANGTTPPPPPPPPVFLKNAAGACLRPAGPYPCWAGGWGNASMCPLVAGACDAEAHWYIEGSAVVSAAHAPAGINVDCNSCKAGAGAKLYEDGTSALALQHGQILFSSCPDACLTNGGPGATPPCGSGAEPWLPTQIHVDSCASAATVGWTATPVNPLEEPAPSRPRSTLSYPHAHRPRSHRRATPTCQDVNALVSRSGAYGPWEQVGVFTGARTPPLYEADNPAPLVFPNGTTWVMYRSWHPPGNTTTPIGIARSTGTTWDGAYTLLPVPVPQGFYNESQPRYIPLEDPFLWQDAATGSFHALFHNMGGCSDVGCHAFSADGYTWYLASAPAYSSVVTRADGKVITYARRERPHLVLNAKGQPAFLSNGVQETWPDDHSYTIVQQIDVAWP